MDKSTSLLIGVFLFLAGSIFNAFYKRASRNIWDYYTMPGQIGTLVLVLTMMGTLVGGGVVIGMAELGAKGGVIVAFLGLGYAAAFLGIAALSTRLRNLTLDAGIFSLFDLFEETYPARFQIPIINRQIGISGIFAVVYFLSYFFILAAQVIAISSFISIFAVGLSQTQSVLIGTGILYGLNTIAYTAWGGIEKDIRMDMFQFVLIVIATLIFFFLLILGGLGPLSSITSLPRKFFDGSAYGYAFLVVAIAAPFPALIVRLDIWQRIIAGRSAEVIRHGFIILALCTLVIYSMFGLIGMYVRATIPEVAARPDLAIYYFVDAESTGWLAGVLLICLFAAVLSSADTFLNSASLSLSRFLFASDWEKLRNETGGERSKNTPLGASLRRRTIIVTLLTGVVAMILGIVLQSIVTLLVGAVSALAILFPVCLYALLNKPISIGAAFWSILVGSVTFLVFAFGMGMANEAFLPSFIVSCLLFFPLNAFSRNKCFPRERHQ